MHFTLRTLFPLAVVASLTVSWSAVAETNRYYVAPKGGADGSAGTRASPLATIAEALKRCKPGCQVQLLAGTYHERVIIKAVCSNKDGTANTCSIGAAPGAKVVLDYRGGDHKKWIDGRTTMSLSGGARNWRIHDVTITNHSPDDRYKPGTKKGGKTGGFNDVVVAWAVSDILFEDTVFTGGGSGIFVSRYAKRLTFNRHRSTKVGWIGEDRPHGHGIYINGEDHLIQNSRIDNNAYLGASLYPHAARITFRNTVFANNGSHGAQVATTKAPDSFSRDHRFINCVFRENGSLGLDLWAKSTGAHVINNTFYRNRYGGFRALAPVVAFTNNLFYETKLPIYGTTVALPNATHNLFHSDGGGKPRQVKAELQLWGDPKFVDVSKNDFRLTKDSPALNAGRREQQASPDIDQTKRPQGSAYEIGAFEYVPTKPRLDASAPKADAGAGLPDAGGRGDTSRPPSDDAQAEPLADSADTPADHDAGTPLPSQAEPPTHESQFDPRAVPGSEGQSVDGGCHSGYGATLPAPAFLLLLVMYRKRPRKIHS